MKRRKRLRRTGILCLHCVRNLCYFRAGEEQAEAPTPQSYWNNVRNNFLDISILEWCKLFADRKGKHFWKEVVEDHDLFHAKLLEKLSITDEMFQNYTKSMKLYRDKFLAHLDELDEANIPNMVVAQKAALHLYGWLLEIEDDCEAYPDAPNPTSFVRARMAEARGVYARYATTTAD